MFGTLVIRMSLLHAGAAQPTLSAWPPGTSEEYFSPRKWRLKRGSKPDCSTELRAISHTSVDESFHTCARARRQRAASFDLRPPPVFAHLRGDRVLLEQRVLRVVQHERVVGRERDVQAAREELAESARARYVSDGVFEGRARRARARLTFRNGERE